MERKVTVVSKTISKTKRPGRVRLRWLTFSYQHTSQLAIQPRIEKRVENVEI